jgi:SnoaL-like domain
MHRWWFNYDEGRMEVLADLLTDDAHLISRTETGQHPHEEFIRSDSFGRDSAMAWTRNHRRHSPYPLRHHGVNIHVTAERDDEIDLESYLLVTQIIDRKPSTLSSGLVHITLRLTPDGYRIARKEVVLDSIESAPFHEVDFVYGRQEAW